jgi:CrcB protein
MIWVAVAVLGGIGALARFFLDAVVSQRIAGGFPWGTLTVNLSGALILGVLTGLALTDGALLLVGTALVGSYTTFSTWMFESHRLGEGGQPKLLWLNLAASIVVGVAAAVLGRAAGTAL